MVCTLADVALLIMKKCQTSIITKWVWSNFHHDKESVEAVIKQVEPMTEWVKMWGGGGGGGQGREGGKGRQMKKKVLSSNANNICF